MKQNITSTLGISITWKLTIIKSVMQNIYERPLQYNMLWQIINHYLYRDTYFV